MVYEVVTARVPDSIMGSTMSSALEWAKKWIKHIRRTWPQTDAELFTNINGDSNQVHMAFRFESMAARDAWWERFGQEEGVKKLTDEIVALEKKGGGNPFWTRLTHNFYNALDLLG